MDKQKGNDSAILLMLVFIWLCSCMQKTSPSTDQVAKNNHRQLSLIHDIEKSSGYRYIHTDTTYAFSYGNGITIQNSLPKGGNIEPGTPYIDSTGKIYFFAAFCTRIINGTNNALELTVNFPGESFPLSSSSDAYLKLLIPTDTMTVDKLSLYSYGLTGMKSFVDINFNQTTRLQKTIKPNEEHFFYIVTISYQAGGPARSAVIMKDKDLFYSITMGPYDPLEIPCGKIAFKNELGN